MTLRYAPLLCLMAALSACSNVAPTENRDVDAQAIKDNEAAWVKDIAAKDAEKWVQHYADDAALSLPGTPIVIGKENIRAALKPFTADPNFSLTFAPGKVEVARSGDLAYSRGAYTMTMTDPATKQPHTEQGKYVTVYRKSGDGKWLAVEDIANADAPAPAAAH